MRRKKKNKPLPKCSATSAAPRARRPQTMPSLCKRRNFSFFWLKMGCNLGLWVWKPGGGHLLIRTNQLQSLHQQLSAGPTNTQQKASIPSRGYLTTAQDLLPQYTRCCGYSTEGFKPMLLLKGLTAVIHCRERSLTLFSQVVLRQLLSYFLRCIPGRGRRHDKYVNTSLEASARITERYWEQSSQ